MFKDDKKLKIQSVFQVGLPTICATLDSQTCDYCRLMHGTIATIKNITPLKGCANDICRCVVEFKKESTDVQCT